MLSDYILGWHCADYIVRFYRVNSIMGIPSWEFHLAPSCSIVWIPSCGFYRADSILFYRTDSIVYSILRVLLCGRNARIASGDRIVQICLEGSHCADWLVRSHRGDYLVGLHFTDASHSAVLIENCAGRAYNLLKYEIIHWLIDTLHEDLTRSS